MLYKEFQGSYRLFWAATRLHKERRVMGLEFRV